MLLSDLWIRQRALKGRNGKLCDAGMIGQNNTVGFLSFSFLNPAGFGEWNRCAVQSRRVGMYGVMPEVQKVGDTFYNVVLSDDSCDLTTQLASVSGSIGLMSVRKHEPLLK